MDLTDFADPGDGQRQLGQSMEQKRVERFMCSAGQTVRLTPTIPPLDERQLRASLHLEETLETIKALGFRIIIKGFHLDSIEGVSDFHLEPSLEPNLVEIVDGCCDTNVVSLGTLSACGVSDVGPMDEVLNANQRKFDPGGYRREDGKWCKPADWTPPDILGELIAQGMPTPGSDS